jgi:hypothetical protein
MQWNDRWNETGKEFNHNVEEQARSKARAQNHLK